MASSRTSSRSHIHGTHNVNIQTIHRGFNSSWKGRKLLGEMAGIHGFFFQFWGRMSRSLDPLRGRILCGSILGDQEMEAPLPKCGT